MVCIEWSDCGAVAVDGGAWDHGNISMETIKILKNPMIMVPYILSAMMALFWPNMEIEIPILTDFLKLIVEL